jgi:hypothetical protein
VTTLIVVTLAVGVCGALRGASLSGMALREDVDVFFRECGTLLQQV